MKTHVVKAIDILDSIQSVINDFREVFEEPKDLPPIWGYPQIQKE